MKENLTLALREQLFPRPGLIYQSYPWKKGQFIFFLLNFLEDEEELDEEERALLSAAIKEFDQQEDVQLPQIYRDYYNGVMETLFRSQITPRVQGPLNAVQLKQCLKWAEEDLHQLQANKRMSEFFIFDLMIGKYKCSSC